MSIKDRKPGSARSSVIEPLEPRTLFAASPAYFPTLEPVPNPSFGQTSFLVSVDYSDPAGFDVSSIHRGQISVTPPSAISRNVGYAELVSATQTSPTAATAVFSLAAPGGKFESCDTGTYTFTLNAPNQNSLGGIFATQTLTVTNIPALPNIVPVVAAATKTWLPGHQNRVTVTLHNTGKKPVKVGAAIDFYLGTEELHTAADYSLGQHSVSLNLAPGQSQTTTFSFLSPAKLLDVSHVIAVVTTKSILPETSKKDNTAASPQSITIVPPHSSLSSRLLSIPSTIPLHGQSTARVRLTNSGPDVADGPAILYFYVGESQNQSTFEFFNTKLSVDLQPHQSQEFTIHFNPAGSYYPISPGYHFVLGEIDLGAEFDGDGFVAKTRFVTNTRILFK